MVARACCAHVHARESSAKNKQLCILHSPEIGQPLFPAVDVTKAAEVSFLHGCRQSGWYCSKRVTCRMWSGVSIPVLHLHITTCTLTQAQSIQVNSWLVSAARIDIWTLWAERALKPIINQERNDSWDLCLQLPAHEPSQSTAGSMKTWFTFICTV